jgi:hypothetical protein
LQETQCQSTCFSFSQDSIDASKNYILAIEMFIPDGTWPTHVPGDPVGDFDRFVALIGGARYSTAATSCSTDGSPQQQQLQQQQEQQNAVQQDAADADEATTGASSWEHELAETLETVFGGIATELKETSVGIVNTARYSQTVNMAT